MAHKNYFTEADQENISISLASISSIRDKRQGLGFTDISKPIQRKRASDFFVAETPLVSSVSVPIQLTANNDLVPTSNNTSIISISCQQELSTSNSLASQMKENVRKGLLKAQQSAVNETDILDKHKYEQVTPKNNSNPNSSKFVMSASLRSAIEDDQTSTILNIYHRNNSNKTPNSSSFLTSADIERENAIYSTSSSDHVSMAPSVPLELQPSEDIPLYKRLKTGDSVQVKYSGDGKYYAALVKSVVHKGFASAKYDVEFKGYTGAAAIETVSWRDIVLVPVGVADEVEKVSKGVGMRDAVLVGVDAFGRDRSLVEAKQQRQTQTEKQNSALLLRLALQNNNNNNNKCMHDFNLLLSEDKHDASYFVNITHFKRCRGAWKIK